MKIAVKNTLKIGLRALFLIWVVVTLIAIVEMQRLWWNRERARYLGKSIIEQRTEVFKWAGIPSEILSYFKEIDSKWPATVNYKATGDLNALSYGTYLLIPRIPSGSKDYSIHVEGSSVRYSGEGSKGPVRRGYSESPSVAGFLSSVLIILGMTFNVRFVWPSIRPSVPEGIGLACLFLMICGIISIGATGTANYGFLIFTTGGGIGWAVALYRWARVNQFKLFTFRMRWRPDPKRNLEHLKAGEKVFSDWADGSGRLDFIYYLLLYSIGFLIFLWAMQMAVVTVPDDWDAWATWGAKAKVLALAEGPLSNVTYFGPKDYPLLWPAVWAFSGWCSGGWEEHWSRGWSVLFMILTAWEIGIIIQKQGGENKKALFGAVLFLSIPMVPLVASWSYAESALCLMMVSCFGCLLRWRRCKGLQNLVIGSIFAAAAAFTKNEGLLFAVLCFVWILIFSGRQWKKTSFAFLVPFLILYIPWVYWIRIVLDIGSDATKALIFNPKVIAKAINRTTEALTLIGTMWKDVRQWNVVLGLLGLAAVVYLIKGGKKQRFDLMLSISLLLGYLVILIHHKNLWWHIGAAWNRLTIQVLPMLIVAILTRPDEGVPGNCSRGVNRLNIFR